MSRPIPSRSFSFQRVGSFQTATLALVGMLHAATSASAQSSTASTGVNLSGTATPASESAASSGATSRREQARAAYFAGKAAFAAGNFAEAEAQFALANSLIPAVQALFWYALSLDGQNKSQLALRAFTSILAHTDRGKLRSEQLQQAAERQDTLKSAPADVLLNTKPAGAHITINGQPMSALTPIPLRLGPGQHEVSVELEGYVTQRFLLTAEAGANISPTVELTPNTPAEPKGLPSLSAPAPILSSSDRAHNTGQSAVPGAVTLGIAGISAVIGTVFGLKALNEKKKFKDEPSAAYADDTERNALIADMAFGVTLTLGITGVVLLLTQDDAAAQSVSRTDPTAAKLKFAPFASWNSAGASATWEF